MICIIFVVVRRRWRVSDVCSLLYSDGLVDRLKNFLIMTEETDENLVGAGEESFGRGRFVEGGGKASVTCFLHWLNRLKE